jgi:hypothetical protein
MASCHTPFAKAAVAKLAWPHHWAVFLFWNFQISISMQNWAVVVPLLILVGVVACRARLERCGEISRGGAENQLLRFTLR